MNELADTHGWIARQRDTEQLAARYSTRRKKQAARRAKMTAKHTEGVHELAVSDGWIARQRDTEQLAARYSTRRKKYCQAGARRG
ncbi:MAG: hypothetical protein SOI56_04705 [Eubacteriales bacterium]